MYQLLRSICMATGGALLVGLSASTTADSATATDSAAPSIQIPANSPKYLLPSYSKALAAPLPSQTASDGTPTVFGSATYPNSQGLGGIYQQGGSVSTSTNAFFRQLGQNGRTCLSCHKPDSGMGVSVSTIDALFTSTNGTDPIFAPIDGANCPNSVPAVNTKAALVGGARGGGLDTFRDAHSLILNKGLIRIFLPVPKETNDLSSVGMPPHPTEFTVSVVSDPNGCNTDPAYSTYTDPKTGVVYQILSVYRRPLLTSNTYFTLIPSATLAFGFFPNDDNVTGAPVVDPVTGLPISGNIMWDGREPTLQTQATNASLIHEQATSAPSAAQIAQIVAFESHTFAAQAASNTAGDLTGANGSGVTGGAQDMSTQHYSVGDFTDFYSWLAPPNPSSPEQAQQQASIARGEYLFNKFPFTVTNVAGFNNGHVYITAPQPATCAACHIAQAGTALLPENQMDIGTGGQSEQFGGPAPSTDLPIFKLTCRAPYTTVYEGNVVLTNDPGMALITGRCADIGRKSIAQMRALSSRAPYFSNGSAATLRAVVEFYDKRFSINFTEQQKEDLVNFMAAL